MADLADLAVLRLRRGAEHVHGLGPRALAELLLEIGATFECNAGILDILATYSRISPEMIRAAGGTAFTPKLRVVPQ